jgi:hypothetical protein
MKRCPLAELERYNINFSCIDYIFKYLYHSILNNKMKCDTPTNPNNPKRNKKIRKNAYFKHIKYNVDEVSLENLIICGGCLVCKIIILMLYEGLYP